MAHKYICEKCGKEKTCTISGCAGDCLKWCLLCIRKTSTKAMAKVIADHRG